MSVCTIWYWFSENLEMFCDQNWVDLCEGDHSSAPE